MSKRMKCAVAGALAGAANGFFGAGGGMFLVPLFTRWVKLETKTAHATSLLVVLPLCAVSAVVYLTRSSLDLALAAPYLVGGLVGGFVGGRVFRKVPTKCLRYAFAALLIVGGVRSVTS
jgi:uncharacterized membrane protein YfcA